MDFKGLVKRLAHVLGVFALEQNWQNENRFQEDWWIKYSPTIDVQFWLNDDSSSANYNKVEVWVYPIFQKNRDEMETDTSSGVLLTVLNKPAKQEELF